MATVPGQRRSARANKGCPPERFRGGLGGGDAPVAGTRRERLETSNGEAGARRLDGASRRLSPGELLYFQELDSELEDEEDLLAGSTDEESAQEYLMSFKEEPGRSTQTRRVTSKANKNVSPTSRISTSKLSSLIDINEPTSTGASRPPPSWLGPDVTITTLGSKSAASRRDDERARRRGSGGAAAAGARPELATSTPVIEGSKTGAADPTALLVDVLKQGLAEQRKQFKAQLQELKAEIAEIKLKVENKIDENSDYKQENVDLVQPGTPKQESENVQGSPPSRSSSGEHGSWAAIDNLARAITTAVQAAANAGVQPARPVEPENGADIRRFVARQTLESKELPIFSGEPEEWPAFYEQFCSSTGECGFSDAENMARLRKALKGRAKEAVSALLPLPGNVAVVIETLKRRFGRPEFVIQSLVRKTRSLEAPREGDMMGLIDYANAVTNLVSTMSLLKSEGHMKNPELRSCLVSKLPSGLQLQWGEQVSLTEEVDLRDFATWLAGRADAASFVADRVDKPKLAKQEQSHLRGLEAEPTSTAGMFGVAMAPTDWDAKVKSLEDGKRKAFARKSNLCFNCLKKGHRAATCRSKSRCSTCQQRHHTLLHSALRIQNAAQQDQERKKLECQSIQTKASIQLMTSVAEVSGVKQRARVRVFLDLGAQASFISEELSDVIKPEVIGNEPVTINAFGAPAVDMHLTRCRVGLTLENGQILHMEALQKASLGVGINPIPADLVQRWKERGVELSDATSHGEISPEVHVLLGADIASKLLRRRKVVDGEVAWDTEIGWVLSGQQQLLNPTSKTSCAVAFVGAAGQCQLNDKVHRLWEQEEPLEVTAERAGPAFPLTKMGDAYQVGLLWKSEKRPEDNRNQAVACAESLLRKLERTGKREAYDEVLLQEYAKLRAIEPDPAPEEPGYYLPHHAVVRDESATTKLRVVFNASAARKGGRSLNNLVEAGPSLLPDLVGLLIRFREYPAALQADIRKAFFMIEVQEEDRRYLRFVWPNADRNMSTFRLCKLPFGVNCSPYILNAVLHKHLGSLAESAIISLLRKSLYVDDCLTSVATDSDAEEFKKVSTAALRSAGMELRKWRGNKMTDDTDAGAKVLGIVWCTEADRLSLVVTDGKPAGNVQWTKRTLLQAVASLFDPLGLASPVQLKGKILLQEAWKEGIGWDDPLPPELATAAESWWGEMQIIPSLTVPRWIGATPSSEAVMHVFADASEKAYGCCIYVVVGDTSMLVYAKTKVAPLKAISLPKLELQAAHLAARRAQFVVESLRTTIKAVHCWSDSLTTLAWIRGQAFKWKTWVRNRVVAIQDVSRAVGMEWRHCPGVENPADLASRGASVSSMQEVRWSNGPKWLLNEELWPKEVDPEQHANPVLQVQAVQVDTTPWWSRISRWTRLVGVAKRLLQWRPRQAKHPATNEEAEKVVIRIVQEDCFGADVASLKAGDSLTKQSKLHSVQPYLDDDGVLRVGGRLSSSELEGCTKHPVLLGKHHVTRLLLESIHQKSMHQGVETVLAMSRERYWIFSARRLLRSIRSKCVVCRRHGAKPADAVTAPLPADRVIYSAPFSVCGVDYAGPLFVKELSNSAKVWIVLFVCGITRALHLDLVRSLKVEDFLLVWRRFVARRGQPKRVRSDNGTTFVAAAKIIQVEWVFNPPGAPWFGGFYERLVGVIKAPLKKVLGKAFLQREELFTLLCEVERAVNSRPLTHVGSINDDEPLTPAALLGEKVWSCNEDGRCQVAELDASEMTKRARYLERLQKNLERRWTYQYLLGLRSFHVGKKSPVAIGDVVLLVDSQRSRQQWKLGRVLRSFAGKDGHHRVVEVKTGSSVVLRPVQRIVPLEVSREQQRESGIQPSQQQQQQESSSDVSQEKRTRTRAIRAPRRLDL